MRTGLFCATIDVPGGVSAEQEPHSMHRYALEELDQLHDKLPGIEVVSCNLWPDQRVDGRWVLSVAFRVPLEHLSDEPRIIEYGHRLGEK